MVEFKLDKLSFVKTESHNEMFPSDRGKLGICYFWVFSEIANVMTYAQII